MDVNKLIDRVIGVEGKYADLPGDKGGPTCWGITEQVAHAYGYTGIMRDLPRPIAAAIYRKRFWDGPGLAQIADVAPSLAAELFDTGVNMGPSIGITFVQRALNVLNRGATDYPDISVDGRVGPMTITALRGFLKHRGADGEKVLIKTCDALQGARYVDITEVRAANEAFFYGWVANRVGNPT